MYHILANQGSRINWNRWVKQGRFTHTLNTITLLGFSSSVNCYYVCACIPFPLPLFQLNSAYMTRNETKNQPQTSTKKNSTLRNYVVNWYNIYLSHPWMDCNNTTINWHYSWPNLRGNIFTHVKVRKTYNKNVKQNLKYSQIPAKEAEAIQWGILSEDLIFPYKIIRGFRIALCYYKL